MHLVRDNYATHKTPKIKTGWHAVHIRVPTPRQHRHPGSIRSKGGLQNWHARSCSAVPADPPLNWRLT